MRLIATGSRARTQVKPDFTFESLVELSIRLSQEHGDDTLRHLSLKSEGGRQRTGMRWNPSSLDGCEKKAVFKAIGVRRDPVVNGYRQQVVFDRGTVVGAWIAAYIRALEDYGEVQNVEAQVDDRKERLIVDRDLSYGGFCDIKFDRGGQRYHVEVKSKDNPTAMQRITGPDAKHDRQLNGYLVVDGVSFGWLVYVGLVDLPEGQTFAIKEFPREVDLGKWSDTKRRIQALDRFADRPDRMPPETSNKRFECPSCPFRVKCQARMTPKQALEAG